jgi:hypothetical protein
VGVLEMSGDPDFAQESLGAQDGRELGMEDLESHGPIVFAVMGQEDGGHAAAPQLTLEGVAVGQGGSQVVQQDGDAVTSS